MSRKKLTLIGLAAVLVGLGITYRVDILVAALGTIERMRAPIEANREIVWSRPGPEDVARHSGKRPPNIIVILTDDMGFNDVSFYSGGMIETPHIDQLARQGVSFANGYSGSAVCSISRVALLTGRYATRSGFEFTPTPNNMGRILGLLANGSEPKRGFVPVEGSKGSELSYQEKGMPSSEVTLAEVLKQADYHTVHIGKWHLGREKEFLPNAQGFDESLLMASGLYLPVDSPDVVNSKQPFDPIDRVVWNIMTYAASFNGGDRFEPRGYLTDYYTEEAVKVIEANKDRPFFLYLAHWGPHTPLQAKKSDYHALADEIPDHRARVYAGMLRSLDRSVGSVMQALKDNGLDDNTLVIFTSDNGGAGYVGLPDVNKPYRGWKLSFFEGGTHVPFFARWPGHLPAGKSFEHPISHMDIMPTAVAAAGVSYTPVSADKSLDGVNLLPYLQGQETSAPHDMLVWRTGSYQAILADSWKMHVSDWPETMVKLYHLAEDPTEQRNVADDHPAKVAQLKALLKAHNNKQAEPLWELSAIMPASVDKSLVEPVSPDDEMIYWQN